MITGKENYTRAIEFKGPAYLPCRIGVSLDWLQDKDESKRRRVRALAARIPDDIMGVGPRDFGVDLGVKAGARHWQDQWGTGWEDDGHGAKTETYPLENGYEALAGYAFPEPNRAGRFDGADEGLKQRGDRYVLGSVWFTLFERLWMLRGFDNMLIDPYMDEANFARLRDRVVDYNLAIIDQLVKREVDGVFFSDDWGCQRGLLMNPDDWRRFYKPAYKRMFDRVRGGGAHVWMHLCGNITAILPDLIDIGLNVLNPVQPQAMDVRALSREFGGKVCFNGGVDVQGTLVRGTPEDVKREVHELVALFGKFNGGYIGGTSHTVMPETPLDNVVAMYEAFAEYMPPPDPTMTVFKTTWEITKEPAQVKPIAEVGLPFTGKEGWRKPDEGFDGFVDFHALDGERAGIMYARGEIVCAVAMTCDLLLGADGPVKVWLDGRQVGIVPEAGNPAVPDRFQFPVTLARGRHTVIVAQDRQGGRAWGFFLRLRRTDQAKMAAGMIEGGLPDVNG